MEKWNGVIETQDQKQGEVKILVPGSQPMVRLLGDRDELLKIIEKAFKSSILVRGNEITIRGDAAELETIGRLFEELL